MNLTGFNSNQIEAINHIEGACCVIAGAGSGKTRVLTYRIGNLIEHGISPENILAVTFTKKASTEMKERLRDLIGGIAYEVNMGTFHSICYRILRDEWEINGSDMINFQIVKSWWQQSIMEQILNEIGSEIDWQPRQALSFISFQKNNLIMPDDRLILDVSLEHLRESLGKVYKEYELRKTDEKYIDFDDMLTLCFNILNDNPNVLQKYRDRFKYVLCDEYQDTNLVQEGILKLIAGEHKNIFVVGDDYQSIYAFRSANVDLIINFEKSWGAKVIQLDINYRSSRNIVNWSNQLILNNTKQYPKNVKAEKQDYEEPIIVETDDEEDEAKYIAQEIVELMEKDKYKPQDIAILYRTNSQSRSLEEEMIKNKIPYIVIGSASFYDRKEIRDIMAYLRLCYNLSDNTSLKRIINIPNRFLGKAFVNSLEEYASDNKISLFEAISQSPKFEGWRYKGAKDFYKNIVKINKTDCTPYDKMRLIRDVFKYDEYLSKNIDGDESCERLENLASLQQMSKRFRDLKDFFDYVDGISAKSNKNADENGKVKLMSIHRSKGLEFPTVFVAGVSKDILPHMYCQKLLEIEEERRLLYVGLTRAEKLLYISYTNMYNGRVAGESMFIQELPNMKNPQKYKKIV